MAHAFRSGWTKRIRAMDAAVLEMVLTAARAEIEALNPAQMLAA